MRRRAAAPTTATAAAVVCFIDAGEVGGLAFFPGLWELPVLEPLHLG